MRGIYGFALFARSICETFSLGSKEMLIANRIFDFISAVILLYKGSSRIDNS